jgi:hypothetical protein
MSTQEGCLYGDSECLFSDLDERTLTERVMDTIGSYMENSGLSACPRCLRDTMLNVAALLHLEGYKSQDGVTVAADAEAEFTRAASHRIEAVLEAVRAKGASRKN